MDISKEITGNSAVIKLDGWLDAQSAPELKAALDELGDEVTELTLDLEKLEYISSAGLRLVVAANKQMNGAMTITGASVEILDLFRMTGFDKRLKIK